MHKIPSNALHFSTERLSSIVLADSNVSESGTPSSWAIILLVLQFRLLILYQAAKWD